MYYDINNGIEICIINICVGCFMVGCFNGFECILFDKCWYCNLEMGMCLEC